MKLFQKIGIILLMILSLVVVLVSVVLIIKNVMFLYKADVTNNTIISINNKLDVVKTCSTTENIIKDQTDYNIYVITSSSLPYLYWKNIVYRDFNIHEVSTSTITSSKKLLLKLDKNFELIQPAYSQDRQLMFFTVLFSYGFSSNTIKGVPFNMNGIYVYQYDNIKDKLKLLFTGKEFNDTKYPEIKYKYFYPRKISSDKNYIFFYVTNCFGCGPSYIGVIYDIKNDEFKNLNLVCDFEWSSGSNYRYKECVLADKCNGEFCFKDPDTLPWKYGKF